MANYNFNEIISAVDALINRIRVTRPGGTRQEQYNQFLSLRLEIERLEDIIDLWEDQVKADYRAGEITRGEYKRVERILDSLDDRLDRAENLLKRIFSIDD